MLQPIKEIERPDGVVGKPDSPALKEAAAGPERCPSDVSCSARAGESILAARSIVAQGSETDSGLFVRMDSSIPEVLERERFQENLRDFLAEYDPVGPTERALLRELARHATAKERWEEAAESVERNAARKLPEVAVRHRFVGAAGLQLGPRDDVVAGRRRQAEHFVLESASPSDELSGLRTALLNAPQFGDVYKHFRGENIPDEPFLSNTLTDSFHIPADKVSEFKSIFFESLDDAKLVENRGDKLRVTDVSEGEGATVDSAKSIKELGKTAHIKEGESCFVMMPFADPIGSYYTKIFEPAIEKTGLRPIRADDDIFAVGKIIDQVWAGIGAAKVLVAELTGRNPNVFYELGLAHALKKPVVLIASNEGDVPFDVRYIRVIYYDKDDPFWGDKLTKKITENILSAINNPEEAIFKSGVNIRA